MNLYRSLWVCVVVFLLASCGGGSSEPPPESVDLLGTAAAEAALAGATVSVKCASGLAQTVTAADGTFAMSIRSGALPCVLEVTGSGHVYRSAVWGSGPGSYRVNVSPLTELVFARIAGANGSTSAAFFSGFGASNTAVTAASLAAAIAYIQTALSGLVDLTGFNPLFDLLVAANGTASANALGSKISNFLAQIAAANTTLDALSIALINGQADPAPLLPKITASPVPATVEASKTTTFSVLATSVLPPSYQWQVSADGGTTFTDVAGATGASYTVLAALVADSGKVFRVRVSSAAGSLTSGVASLTVTVPTPSAPVITVQPQDTSVAYGQAAVFSVSAASSLGLSYQWSRGGVAINGATGSSYSTAITVAGDNGAAFSVTVTDSNGSAVSASAMLTVTGIPAASPSRVAAGSSHSVAIQSDGTVLSWGNIKADIGTSLSGLMGVGSDSVVAGTPTVAKNANGTVFSGAKAIAASQWSTLVLKTDGTVWGWGYSGWGNLGNSTSFFFEQKSPVQAKLADGSALSSVVQIAVGAYSTSMAVTADGTVWGWGQNRYGHLGIGSASESGQATPVAMLSPSGAGRFTGAVQAAPSISSAAVLKGDGTVFTVGWAAGLGDGSTANRTLPARVELAPGVPLTNVISIQAGGHTYVAVTAAGIAYAWGDNGSGQLGDGSLLPRSRPVVVSDASGKPVTGIVAAGAGSDYMMLLKSDGTVWATGNNDIGQLGTNSTAPYLVNPALVKDASGATFGNVINIAVLDAHTVARRNDGTVWAWGSNAYMQLGDMTTVNRRNPFKVQLPAQ